jgi:hypothetical protein
VRIKLEKKLKIKIIDERIKSKTLENFINTRMVF